MRFGYDLAKTVTFGARTGHPVSRLVNVVRRMDVDAVITPSLEHFGGDVPDELVRACEVNTVSPVATYAPRTLIRFVDEDGA
jgi:hypothetical protein